MAGISGRLLGLQANGIFISCEVQSSINFQANMLPASAVDSARWAEFIAGLRSWTISIDGQLLAEAVGADFKTLMNSFFSGLPVFLIWGTRPSATTQMSLSGNAVLASGSATGPGKGASTWNMVFNGSGELKASFEDFALIIDAMPASADYPVIVDERVT
jgi:predicted secreted protein